MQLGKQLLNVLFAAADQRTTAKRLRLGTPTVAENVVQTKTGSYRKRGGFAATDRTTDTGSITTGRDLVVDNGVPVMRTADAVYARSGGRWVRRGAYRAVSPGQVPVMAGRAARPLQVVTGTQVWTFVQDPDGTYFYQVVDGGVEVVAPTRVSFSGFLWARAVSSTGKVWLFCGPSSPFGTNNTIKLFQFATASPATAPTSTTFANPGGVSVDAWDVIDAQAGGNGIVVAVGSKDGAGINFGGASRHLFFGRLDTATGLVDGTGWVGDASLALGTFGSPLAWIRSTQAAATLHCIWRRTSNGHVYLTAVTAAGLASTSVDMTAAGGSLASTKGGLCGYRESATGNIVWFATDNNTPTPGTESATITRFSWDGATLTGTSANFARARLATSDPFLVSGTPYIVVQHDDTVSLQTAYYVLDASASPGRIVARTLYQLGGNLWHRADRTNGNDQWDNGWICPVAVSGSVASLAVASSVSNVWSTVRLSFDFAPTDLGPPLVAADGQLVAFPGGWPMSLSGGAALADLTPGMYPRDTWSVTGVAVTSTLAAGDYICSVVYVIVDSHGNVYRSVPSPEKTVTITAGQGIRFSNIPTLRVGNTDASKVFILLYVTDAGLTEPFLVARYANAPTADTLGNVDVTGPAIDGAEILYTDGAALEYISAPPWKWAASWRNRVVLGGTDAPDAVVWPSFELATGLGPAWNETVTFRLPDGSGKDTWGCPVDYNYFALAKSDSIWLIAGAGPNGVGVGSYGNTIQQVPDAPGSTNARSVVQTPLGPMYQAINGEIWLISRGGGARYIGEGWDDHKGATVTAAVHWPHESLVLFFTDSGKALVYDYGNPLPDVGAPGQSYVWNLPAAGVAAAISGASLYYLDATGVMRTYQPATFNDDGAPILRKLKFPIVPAGVRGDVRIWKGHVVGQYVSPTSLKVTVDAYVGVAGEAGSSTEPFGPKAVTAGPYLFDFSPAAGRSSAWNITLEDTGTDTGEGASWDGLALLVGMRPGLPPVNSGARF
jgi:hypothetical protein